MPERVSRVMRAVVKSPRVIAGRIEVLEVAAPRGGQPVEPHREDQDQHDAEPEGRHGLAEQRHHRRDVVDRRVAPHRRDDAGGNGQAQRDEQPRAGQLEGGGQPLEHEVHGGLAVAQRLAEVAAHRALEEAQVLDRDRIVEAHRLAELRDVLGGRVGRQQERGRDRRSGAG